MINWMYYPKNQRPDPISNQIVDAFKAIAAEIDSFTHETQESNVVLAKVCPGLESCGFRVEKSKKEIDCINVPVLFGINGNVEKSFKADAYLESAKYVVEVEAGRGVVNYQFLKDFFEACTMNEVDKLCIAVRNDYKKSNDFAKVCTFFDTLYASGRLGIPLKGILIIGY